MTENAKDLPFKLPVTFNKDVGMFFDADNKHIADIRGWGHIQYLSNPEETQDRMGKLIVTAINEYYTRSTPQQPSEPMKELDEEKVYNAILDAFYPTTYWTDGLGRALAKAVCSKFGQPSEKKSKAEAIHEAIRNADVGDDIVIHNEDMSVWCILNLVTREHPERESNGKDRS